MKVFFTFGAMLLLAGTQTASAGLILESFQNFGGTGLGTVPTIVTFQNNPTETGCVGQGGAIGSVLVGGVCSAGGDTKTGNSQSQLQALSVAGITSTGAAGAASFGLIFNGVQPSGGPLLVTSVIAAFYSPTGTFLYQTAGLFCQTTPGGPITAAAGGCLLTQTATGTGNSGYLIVLDAAQQAAAVAAGAFSSVNNLVGVSAAAGGTAGPSAGGSETIFLANSGGTVPIGGQLPEPATYLLVGSALGLVGLTKRFRKA